MAKSEKTSLYEIDGVGSPEEMTFDDSGDEVSLPDLTWVCRAADACGFAVVLDWQTEESKFRLWFVPKEF